MTRTAKRKHLVSAAKSRASKSGNAGESVVQTYNDVAEGRGVAFVRKIPTPTTWTKTGLQYTKASTVDYAGFLHGGRAVFIECKRVTSKSRFYLSEVEVHQAACLNIALDYGAAAVLVVVLGHEGFVCEIPWQDARDKVSMSREELLRYLVNPITYLRRFLAPETKKAAGGE